jgi:hypothetical protein
VAPTAPVIAVPPVEFNFGEAPDLRAVMLRALFMTDQDLTPHDIVDQCARLPGLRSCLAIVPDGVVASEHNAANEDVSHFTANAPRAHEYLTGLAESMGIESKGSFTLRSGNTVRTFFVESKICLAVLHGEPRFEPGVRDKLILTARALAEIIA